MNKDLIENKLKHALIAVNHKSWTKKTWEFLMNKVHNNYEEDKK